MYASVYQYHCVVVSSQNSQIFPFLVSHPRFFSCPACPLDPWRPPFASSSPNAVALNPPNASQWRRRSMGATGWGIYVFVMKSATSRKPHMLGHLNVYVLQLFVICICIHIYNHDRLLRICPISTLRVWTEKKKLRIFGVEIFGVKFWSA